MDDSFKVASYLSIIICFYITFFFEVSVEYQSAEYFTQFAYKIGCFVLSLIQLVFTILYFYFWYKLNLWF